jgi:hypothetical protein
MILTTDYERQLYVGLSTDDWGDFSPNEGDVVYLMDQSKCFMFDGSTMHELPDLGGGGGCPVLTKLGYGDYTVTAAASSITIPVTHTGTVDVIDYIKDSVTSGVGQVYSGLRQLTPPAVDNVASFLLTSSNFGVYSQYASNGERNWNGATANHASMLTYNGTPSAMTGINIPQQSSVTKVQPGTYHWELWGYES